MCQIVIISAIKIIVYVECFFIDVNTEAKNQIKIFRIFQSML